MGPTEEPLFVKIFERCFHHSKLQKSELELWKLKTHFRCFQVIENWVQWQTCKKIKFMGPMSSQNLLIDSTLAHFFFSFKSFFSPFPLYSSPHPSLFLLSHLFFSFQRLELLLVNRRGTCRDQSLCPWDPTSSLARPALSPASCHSTCGS